MQTVRKINKRFWRHAALTAGIAVVPFAVGTAVLVSPHAAQADAQTYATSKRQYKVGILLIDSTADSNLDGTISPAEAAKGPENSDPHIFYIADQRNDIKPNGWDLINPLAPASVTTDIYNRWSAAGGRDPGHPYKVGQNVTKDMAAYWEVSLSKATEAELLQFDLLFITNHRRTRFSPADTEKLRKLVDAGGVVWMDDCGGMRIDPSGRFFLNELQFHGTNPGLNGTAGPVIYQPAHPLLNAPYVLSYDDILRLGDKGYGDYYMVTMPIGATDTNTISLTAPNKETLTTIIANNSGTDGVTNLKLPYLSAGVYGSGSVILSSADIGCGVNDYVGGANSGSGGNSGAYSGNNLLAANIEDLKITYNAIAWGGANNTVRRNNRRTASSFSATSAPLNPAFDFTKTPGNAVNSSSSPLISQGIMYVAGVSGGNYTLRAYDTIPGRDYDNDGNFDDGIPDLITGTPYDEIWRWTGGAATAQPSSPVLATINVGGSPVDVILLTLGDGTVVAFNARPIDTATGRLLPGAVVLGSNSPTQSGGTFTGVARPRNGVDGNDVPDGVAPAPVFFANKIYAVEPTQGIVRCIDASTFTTLWKSTTATTTYVPTGSPTLGLNRLVVVKTRDTGRPSTENNIASNTDETTNDVMMYVPVGDSSNGSSIVLPYWLGARNEGTKDLNNNAGTTIMNLRPAGSEKDKCFISKGGTGFITPTAQLYADVTVTVGTDTIRYTREQNFAAGRAVYPVVDPFFTSQGYTDTWGVNWLDSDTNAAFYDGRLSILHNGSAANANVDHVLAVASYDLVYVPASGAAPTLLATKPGNRNAAPLTIPNSTSLDTVAFAPNDLLLYTANQTGTPSTGTGQTFGVLDAMQEREFSTSASRLRWRYLMHEGSPVGTQVNGISVTDLPALRNRMIFNTSDPVNPLKVATLSSTTPFYESLSKVKFIGSPITTNDGVTYAMARATSAANSTGDPGNPDGTMTVLMAFQTVPQITLELGEPVQANTAVTLSQYDPLNQTTVSSTGDTNDRTRVDVDYQTGRITVADFGALNNGANQLSASSAFVVTYTRATGNTNGVAAAPVSKAIYPFGSVPPVTTGEDSINVTQAPVGTSSGGFSPLLWYYVLPGQPQSAPTKIGDQLFITSKINGVNRVIALDADPAGNDSTVRVRSGEQVYGVAETIAYGASSSRPVDRNHVRWLGTLQGSTDAIGLGSPAGGEGALGINTPAGTNAFSEGLTLMADNTRVMEVNADGAAVWTVDGTSEVQTSGGAAPIYDANGDLTTPNTTRGRQTYNTKSLSSPQTVRRLSSSDYLVADTGNNRVVRFDRAGTSSWNLERINDPLGVLAPGDPLTLSSPTDVLTRRLSSFDSAGNRIGYEVHYIIADSGNSRIIDVVDYYDLNGRVRSFNINGVDGIDDKDVTTHVVVWSTKTKSAGGGSLNYHNLQLSAEQDGALYGKPVLVASVSNTSVAASNNADTANAAGGSVVRLDYNPLNTGFILVDNMGNGTIKYYAGGGLDTGTGIPTAGTTAPATDGRVLLAVNQLRFINGANSTTKRLSRPSYFEQIPLNITGTAVEPVFLIADSAGVYLCRLNTTAGAYFDVVWAFGQAEYNAMNATSRLYNPSGSTVLPPFSPSTVKRLANGHFLITNSAVGASPLFESGQFLGEVFEVNPVAFDISGTTINNTVAGGSFADFSAPRLIKGQNATGTTARVLNKQQMGRDRNGATLTEQPRSADRL